MRVRIELGDEQRLQSPNDFASGHQHTGDTSFRGSVESHPGGAFDQPQRKWYYMRCPGQGLKPERLQERK